MDKSLGAEVSARAQAADAMLADGVVSGEEVDTLLGHGAASGSAGSDVCLPTGVLNVDSALGGGMLGGQVLLVSKEVETGGQLPLTLLTTFLVTCPHSTAAVIDATGHFDILGLYSRLLTALQDPERLKVVHAALGEVTAEEGAKAMLDHVRIMRVFDFVGMKEALSEVKEGLEGTKPKEYEGLEERENEVEKEQQPIRSTIADSEDEDEEILFDIEVRPESQPQILPRQPSIDDAGGEEGKDGEQGRIRFLLIDNLAHVLNPLLKQNYVQANIATSSFLTSLSSLTRTHALHTVLLNPTTTPRTPTQLTNPQQPQPPVPPSIFSSNTTVPSAMGLLGRHADVHVLVTRVPRGRADARMHYGSGNGSGYRGKKADMMDVVEVVESRWTGGVGAWGAMN